MIATTFGDMSKRLAMQRLGSDLKRAVTDLSQEMTTGLVKDTSRRLNGELSPLAGINNAISMSVARISNAQFASTVFSIQQAILGDLGEKAQAGFLDQIIHSPSVSNAELTRSIDQMQNRFRDAVAQINTDFGGRALFAGTSGHGPALVGADEMLAMIFDDLMASYPTGPDSNTASNFIAAWFAEGGQFEMSGYLGGPPIPARLDLGHGMTVGFDITAQDRTLRQLLAALATGAILSPGLLDADRQQRQTMLQHAAQSLASSHSGLIALSARIGMQEERAFLGQSRAEAENTAMSIARGKLLEADPYQTAVKLEQAMTQLDMIYNLTARLSRLSLATYLR